MITALKLCFGFWVEYLCIDANSNKVMFIPCDVLDLFPRLQSIAHTLQSCLSKLIYQKKTVCERRWEPVKWEPIHLK